LSWIIGDEYTKVAKNAQIPKMLTMLIKVIAALGLWMVARKGNHVKAGIGQWCSVCESK
jgi:hypothetical protein